MHYSYIAQNLLHKPYNYIHVSRYVHCKTHHDKSFLLMELVKKQKSKSKAVVKKDCKARVKKTKVQKKTMSLNDSSIGVLLRKLLVVLKG